MKNCSACAKAINDSAEFCPYCGKKQSPTEKQCPACYAKVAPDAKFCGSCGKALSQQSAPETSTNTWQESQTSGKMPEFLSSKNRTRQQIETRLAPRFSVPKFVVGGILIAISHIVFFISMKFFAAQEEYEQEAKRNYQIRMEEYERNNSYNRYSGYNSYNHYNSYNSYNTYRPILYYNNNREYTGIILLIVSGVLTLVGVFLVILPFIRKKKLRRELEEIVKQERDFLTSQAANMQ